MFRKISRNIVFLSSDMSDRCTSDSYSSELVSDKLE